MGKIGRVLKTEELVEMSKLPIVVIRYYRIRGKFELGTKKVC